MKALYRKYRPLKLEDVVGQAQVTDALSASLEQGRISHAYLFIGPRGCGKTSVARIFAHNVNGFKYELEDDYVDIIEIDGASNRGIDNIRELREKALIAPTKGKYKIYIIDEVHMLTKEAFNALLKTLEEPPEHVIFIMATTDAHKVPVTISSRSQTYVFKLADAKTMLGFLRSIAEKEGIKIDDDALEVIAKRGGGSFRDSVSLLDQIATLSKEKITKGMVVAAMGLPEDEKIAGLLVSYVKKDTAEITTALKDLLSSGIKSETLAEELVNTIISEPRPEWLSLLEKLPEVREPFGEAKLLVALMPKPVASVQTEHPNAPRINHLAESPAKIDPAQSPKTAQAESALQDKAPATPFNWEEFRGRVMSVNDAVSAQLRRCEYEMRGNALHIFPRTKIIRSIIAREGNKEILIHAAGGMKIEVHEPGEHPESAEKDEMLEKISDIMKGEVIDDDGGENPF